MDYKEINSLIAKYIRKRNNSIAKSEEFLEALINAENALRELKNSINHNSIVGLIVLL